MNEASTPIDVLVVDDDPAVLRSWREILRDPRYRLTLIGDPLAAAARLGELPIDVAVVDLRMPGLSGMELLTRIKTQRPEVEVVMMTGLGGVADAVEAIKRGAFDFLSKPFASNEAAELTVRRAAELRRLERRVAQLEREVQGDALHRIVGQSPAIIQIVELVGGEPTFTSLVDYDGEVFQVQSSEWGDGVFEWTYLVPSTGYIVHEVVTSADRGSLCTIWSNQNDRGTSCYTR